MVLDDVTLMVCTPPTPTPIPPTPAPTNTPPPPPTAAITPTTALAPVLPEVIPTDLPGALERTAETLTTDLPARILSFVLRYPPLLLIPILLVAAVVFWFRSRKTRASN